MKRASYRAGVNWIAINDEPADVDPKTVSEYTSTMLLADLFGKTPERVAKDIVRVRKAADGVLSRMPFRRGLDT